jgi:hypothetical protein
MVTRPKGVHSRYIGHGTTAVLNVRTGRWIWLDRDSLRIWEAALSEQLPLLVGEFTARGFPHEEVRTAVDFVLRQLAAQGLITASRRPGGARRRCALWRSS